MTSSEADGTLGTCPRSSRPAFRLCGCTVGQGRLGRVRPGRPPGSGEGRAGARGNPSWGSPRLRARSRRRPRPAGSGGRGRPGGWGEGSGGLRAQPAAARTPSLALGAGAAGRARQSPLCPRRGLQLVPGVAPRARARRRREIESWQRTWRCRPACLPSGGPLALSALSYLCACNSWVARRPRVRPRDPPPRSPASAQLRDSWHREAAVS